MRRVPTHSPCDRRRSAATFPVSEVGFESIKWAFFLLFDAQNGLTFTDQPTRFSRSRRASSKPKGCADRCPDVLRRERPRRQSSVAAFRRGLRKLGVEGRKRIRFFGRSWTVIYARRARVMWNLELSRSGNGVRNGFRRRMGW